MDKAARVAHFQSKLDAEWGPYDLKKNMDKVFLIDARGADSFRAAHIPGAVNIPVSEIENRLQEIPKEKTVVTYCADITCHAAPRAALALAKAGYDVKELVGGIDEWKKGGNPVEAGTLTAVN